MVRCERFSGKFRIVLQQSVSTKLSHSKRDHLILTGKRLAEFELDLTTSFKMVKARVGSYFQVLNFISVVVLKSSV